MGHLIRKDEAAVCLAFVYQNLSLMVVGPVDQTPLFIDSNITKRGTFFHHMVEELVVGVEGCDTATVFCCTDSIEGTVLGKG